MGRPKLDSFWYVFVTTGGVALAASLYNCATAPPRDSFSDEEFWAGFFAILGVGLLIQGLQLLAKHWSRVRVPKDVRKPKG